MAPAAIEKELVKTFLDLVRIPSPSGREREVQQYIKKYLAKLGIKSYFDAAGKQVGSNAGNLIAKIGSGKPTIMFVAHVDTVEDGKKKIKPKIKNGVITSDGTTILGSDDKAGVAALLEAIKELKNQKYLPTIVCVFAITEESGTMGVKHLHLNEKIDFAFDVDGSDAPGIFINKALGNMNFEIHIYGKEAHAARSPEKGANAIKAAGMIIASTNIGKDSKGKTLNIGRVSGGRAINVVPATALLEGEVRGFTSENMASKLNEVEQATKKACKATGCTYKIIQKKQSYSPPFSTPAKGAIVRLAKKASVLAGLEFRLKTLSATIQSNLLSEKGYTILGLCKGGKGAHSNKEQIKIKELKKTKNLLVQLARQAKEVRV